MLAQICKVLIYTLVIYVPFSETISAHLSAPFFYVARFSQDILYLITLGATLLYCREQRLTVILPRALRLSLVVLLVVASVTLIFVNGSQQLAADAAEQPLLMGFVGLKVLLAYSLVIACVYYALPTEADVIRFFRFQTGLVLVCCGLGVLQYGLLATGLCPLEHNGFLFSAGSSARCLVGGSLLYGPAHPHIRLPGTFASPWQWSWFLASSVFFLFGTATQDRNRLGRWAGWLGIAIALVISPLSGHRSIFALILVALIVLIVTSGQLTLVKSFHFLGAAIAVVLVLVSVIDLAQFPSVEILLARWQDSPPTAYLFEEFHHTLEEGGLWGQGLGRATNMARIFGSTLLIESYPSKLLYEIGLVGLIATLALYVTLVIATYQAYQNITVQTLRPYGLAMWGFILLITVNPYYYPLDVAPVNIYYWLAAGLTLRLARIAAPRDSLE